MAEDDTATTPTSEEGEKVETTSEGQAPAEVSPEQKQDMSTEDYKAALAKANAEAAKYRVERNELRGDAQAYREMKESEKTELQRTQEALETERARAKEFEVKLQRSQVLSQYGISEDDADLLGSDPEKFESNAQRIQAIAQDAAKRVAPPSDLPVESLTPGTGGSSQVAPDFGFPDTWPITGPFANK